MPQGFVGSTGTPGQHAGQPPVPAEGPLNGAIPSRSQTGDALGGQAGRRRLLQGQGQGQDAAMVHGTGGEAHRRQQLASANRQQQPFTGKAMAPQ